MYKILTVITLILSVFTFSCIDPPTNDTAAAPTANPGAGTYSAAQTVTLSTATSGAGIYYTTNGADPTTTSTLYTNPINITSTTTLKAIAVKEGMNNSEIKTFVYTIHGNGYEPCEDCGEEDCVCGENPCEDCGKVDCICGEGGDDPVMIDPALLGLTGTDISATYIINGASMVITISNYSDPASIAAFTIPSGDFRNAVNGKAITVNLVSNVEVTVSLAYIHYLRQALITAGAVSISVDAPVDIFTPVFDGRDWWTHWNGTAVNNLYGDYSNTTELMNNITISMVNGKRVIKYDRDLKISRLVWQNDDGGVGLSPEAPFRGFGLEKGNGNVVSNNNIIVIGGYFSEINQDGSYTNLYYPIVNDFSAYIAALRTAGLHPADGVFLDHSRVRITDHGDITNIAANGMYDFILEYYNPDGNNNFGNRTDRNAQLFQHWPAGLTFDGRATPDGITSRNIGGIMAANANRKGTDGTGMPNNDYVGNITVPMANYLRSIGVNAFQNTNILGDGTRWNGTNTFDLPLLTNVGLMGNYGGMTINNGHTKRIRGVLDITGTAPVTISNDEKAGYLNLWNVSSDIGINRFDIISIKDLNGINRVNVVDIWPTGIGPANVIIYPKKYNTNDINGESGDLRPSYRAFFDGNTPKITPVSGVDAAYRGTDTSGTAQVPPLDEASWINAANNNDGAAPAFSSYADAPKWDAAAFNALPVE